VDLSSDLVPQASACRTEEGKWKQKCDGVSPTITRQSAISVNKSGQQTDLLQRSKHCSTKLTQPCLWLHVLLPRACHHKLYFKLLMFVSHEQGYFSVTYSFELYPIPAHVSCTHQKFTFRVYIHNLCPTLQVVQHIGEEFVCAIGFTIQREDLFGEWISL
jgi:hypothetical protein